MITGTTRLLAIVGDPIDKVRSPEGFLRRFRANGIDAIMIPVHVTPGDLAVVVGGLKRIRNLAGIVATMPHKTACMTFADEVLETGRLVGAVNALRPLPDGRWQADMFDGQGFVAGLHARGLDARGRKVALIGAGGAGSAIAVSLARAGIASITVHDVDGAKAERLVATLGSAFPALAARAAPPDLATVNLLVNATPIGMESNDALPWPLDRLRPGTIVGDVTTKPDTPPIIAAAERLGAPVVRGADMYEGQVRALGAFFGFDFSRDA